MRAIFVRNVVYMHFTAKTGRLFYIGMGSPRRAYSLSRTKYWKEVAGIEGYVVEIMAWNLTREDASALERLLIQEFRKIYPLTNITLGGSPEFKGLSESAYLKKSMERENIRAAQEECARRRGEKAKQKLDEKRKKDHERKRRVFDMRYPYKWGFTNPYELE